MLKKIWALCLLLTLLAPTALAEGIVGEARVVELPVWGSSTVVPLADGGFFMMGGEKLRNGPPRPTAIRLDAQGNLMPDVTLTSEELPEWLDLTLLSDGRYVSRRGGLASWDLVIFGDQQVLSSRSIVPGNDNVWPSLLPGKNGIFAQYGESKHRDKHGGTFYVLALEYFDNDGNTLWRHTFEDHEVYFNASLPVEDGHILVGRMEEQKTGKRNDVAVIAKMSDTGELLWLTETTTKRWKYFADVVQTPDGGFITFGSHTVERKEKIGVNPSKGVIARYTQDGEPVYEREFDLGLETVWPVMLLPVEGGYLLAVKEKTYRSPMQLLYINEGGDILQELSIDPIPDTQAGQILLDTYQGQCRLIQTFTADDGGQISLRITELKIAPR